MVKKSYYREIKLVLTSLFFVFLLSGCANTSFKISKEAQNITIEPHDKVLLVVTSIDYDFAKLVRDYVYDGFQKKNFNTLNYSDVLPAISINKDADNVSDFCKNNDIKYIIKLENCTCVKATGYMPPSQKLETYTYYSNGKLQTGTRNVSVPGYYYTYLQAYLLVNILDAKTESSLVKVQATTTGSMSAVESHVAKSMSKKIVNKIVRMVRGEK